MGGYSNIVGKFNSQVVEFEKKYDVSSIPEKEMKRKLKIRDILEPKYKGFPYLNPHTIVYRGQCSIDGKEYSGSWQFESEIADMATKGRFGLHKL